MSREAAENASRDQLDNAQGGAVKISGYAPSGRYPAIAGSRSNRDLT
jgi:hypothetical protein